MNSGIRMLPPARARAWAWASAPLLAAALAAGTLPLTAAAQTPPGAAEAAQYDGLLKAAWQGDVARIERLLASGADVHARDAAGRTALHVATFARQREAIRRLAAAGANLGALENARYDAVTIAAVANDEDTLRLLLGGGVPVKVGNETIGAVGVGGAPGGHLDEQCAVAAIAKVQDLLK